MINFNVQCFLDAANELVRADEVSRALNLLNNLPAFYRDYPPSEVLALRDKILKKVCTPRDYINSLDLETEESALECKKLLRYQVIHHDIKHFNDKNLIPHLIDCGPGSYWLPRNLKSDGLEFTYSDLRLSDKTFEVYKDDLKYVLSDVPKNRPIIFNATEIIEHLWNEEDLRIEMLKACGLADIISISTPMYTFDVGCLDWDKTKENLGHLQAFTPNEFTTLISRMFPEYHQDFYKAQIMHSRLILKYSKYELHKLQLELTEIDNPYDKMIPK